MNVSKTASGSPELLASTELAPIDDETPAMRSRWIIPPSPEGWDGYVLSEWELRSAGFADHHPHTEVNVVVEGELHVEANGVTVVALVGDTVRTPAGAVGRYWAPVYARMIAVYGRNPDAAPTEYLSYWDIPQTEGDEELSDD